jgi:hypothetical protein
MTTKQHDHSCSSVLLACLEALVPTENTHQGCPGQFYMMCFWSSIDVQHQPPTHLLSASYVKNLTAELGMMRRQLAPFPLNMPCRLIAESAQDCC